MLNIYDYILTNKCYLSLFGIKIITYASYARHLKMFDN